MKGSAKIIEALNEILTGELTAINQYFLHARMLQNWGLKLLGKLEYEASIDEMKHADQIIQRILFLDGLPNLQKMEKLLIGENVAEIFEADMKLEMVALKRLKKNIALCEGEHDYVTRDLFLEILKSEEDHVDWLETQQNLLKQVGLQNFLQSHIGEHK